jgi:hypothetical protein
MDVDDWKKHTDYRGYTESDDVVQWFWKVTDPPEKGYSNTGDTDMGCRKEIAITAIHHRNISNPSQRI